MSDNKKPVDSRKNGLFFNEKYIPEELLFRIFCYCDHKTLLSCQFVCKYWKFLIQDFVWRKKAEQTVGHALPVVKEIPWLDYYFICDKKMFNKNLIKNHSGEMGNTDNWQILNGGYGWTVRNSLFGPPLPNDPIFKYINSYFATTVAKCPKYQEIDLIKEGFTKYILDYFQPTIKVSEWYSCQWECPSLYQCGIVLTKANGEIIKTYTFRKKLDDEFRDQWFQFSHEFKNYGPGLRKISFIHGGRKERHNSSRYGAKMAGACVKLV